MYATNFWKVPFALSLCLATSFSHSDEQDLSLIVASESKSAKDETASNLNSRVSTLESRMAAIRTETPKHTVGAQMASASPLYDGFGLFVTADLLYWHLYEGGTDFSLSQHTSGLLNFPTVSGKSSRVNFDWDWGFRIGGGYNFEHDAWDAYVNFTWFQTDGSHTAHAPSNGTVIPQKGALDTLTANKIEADWDVHNYVIDLELGRRFFVSKFLSFRPQFGLETAWIYQHRHFDVDQPIDLTTGIEGESIHGRCNFWGIGPRTGVEGTWFFGRHFSLFGSVSGALLWGRFDTKNKEKLELSSGDRSSLVVKDDFHRLVPNAQMALGLSWDANLSEEQYHLGIKLGYEFQYWWRQNQFLNEEQLSFFGLRHESKDMMLNGVTLDVRFDF